MSRYHLSKNYVPGTVCRDGKLLSIQEVVDELNRLAEQLDVERARVDAAREFMAFSPRDWGLDHRDAALWALVVGWNAAAMEEMRARHGWNDTHRAVTLCRQTGSGSTGTSHQYETRIDVMLAELHAAIWEAAEKGDVDYDLAGIDVAKRLRAEAHTTEQREQALAAHVDEARQIATHWIENEQTTANVWELARKIGRWSLSAPETSLARVKAEAYEAGYVDGWDHRAGTKPGDGDYRACGRRLAKQLADGKYRGAGDIT
ncbi:hypothetical protein [Billgrantia desiderata]|uniref:hypothetical protein n=1 Tax=Billgrantia desiderata TaxID=52021 RepID=UPI001F2988E3|nr:hypothetical protein [Halomonas desiderata]MCE8012916.1 hypothetical protein [Halomonas desiderata]